MLQTHRTFPTDSPTYNKLCSSTPQRKSPPRGEKASIGWCRIQPTVDGGGLKGRFSYASTKSSVYKRCDVLFGHTRCRSLLIGCFVYNAELFFFIRRQPRARLIAHRSIIRLDLPSYSPLEDVCSVWTFESHIEPRNPWCTSTVPDRSGMWALRKWKFFTEVYNSIELWSMHYKLYFRVSYYMFFILFKKIAAHQIDQIFLF